MNKFFDPTYEALSIIAEHTQGFMMSTDYVPETNMNLMDAMMHECAFILTDKWLDGDYTPMEYNAVRNELAHIFWRQFKGYIKEE